MQKEKLVEIAFAIIGHAGEAFDCFNTALKKAEAGDFDEIDTWMEKGSASLANAHQAQMELIVEEARGNEVPYSLTMVHAQDHLMNAVLFESVAKHFITLLKAK